MRDIKKIKTFLKKYELVWAWAALIALLTGFFTAYQPIKYDVSLSLFVSRLGTQQINEYKYDGYYALKASDEFAENVKYWLKSPEIVTNIFRRAEIDLTAKSFRSLTKTFKAEKLASQYLEVRFTIKSEEEARKIADSISRVLQERANVINAGSWQSIAFSITGSEPIIIQKKPGLIVNSFMGLIIGLVLGGLFIAGWEKLKLKQIL